ncbi:hypothetical protein RM609_16950 [Streptomyces sp. DSM 40473]|uniref:DUF6879 domain-containing protein n=2 Tax=Streptomyces hesseae TaxID=3075519 RepID=A0ABU2SPR8_9ACTN|nr:DUF6879 family protein [Streptomyces sp. DSM 40473]MDT0450753.1 hypothetical protein [Streptomyces sp. DSM 40473]
MFREFEHTAWRLETQREYAVDRDSPKWQRWLNGERLGYDPRHPWHANVRAQAEAGKRFERVRIVDGPPTDGQRFLLASGLGNVEAGEDIRNIRRADAERHGLPDFDFWLFDSRLLVRFHFDERGVTLGVEVTEEPSAVLWGCQVRDLAWHHALPTAEFQHGASPTA